MASRRLPELPCGPILELHGQRKRFHVPYGLKKLLEDITREVLRSQPENIYSFLAEFMEARGKRRQSDAEKQIHRKSWQVHRWSWEGKSILDPEELKEFLGSLRMSEEATTHHAIVIQSAYRGWQARKKVKEIRKSLRSSRGAELPTEMTIPPPSTSLEGEAILEPEKPEDLEEPEDPEEFKEFLETLDMSEEATTHHAIVIQSAYRGWQARKKVKEIRKSVSGVLEAEQPTEMTIPPPST